MRYLPVREEQLKERLSKRFRDLDMIYQQNHAPKAAAISIHD